MKNAFQFLIVILIFLISCNYSSKKKQEASLYKKDGLSIMLPKYWKVEKDRPIEGVKGSRFLSVSNNEPLNGEEFFVITAIDTGNTLASTMDNLIKQSRISYNKRNVEFGLLNENEELTIGDLKILRTDFETKIIGNRYKGSFTVFNLKDKTYSFVSSAEAKNVKEHTKTIDSIIKSLKVD